MRSYVVLAVGIAVLAIKLNVQAQVTVQSVVPPTGPTNGGTSVAIKGTGFVTGATVSLGGAMLADVKVISSTLIAGITSPHAQGAVDVVVTDSNGTGTLTGGYTYVPPSPSCYSPVQAWRGVYTLNASASGVACVGGGTCNIDQSATAATASLSSGAITCSLLNWITADSLSEVSMNDTQFIPCQGGGQSTSTDQGSTGESANGIIWISVTGNSEYYAPQPVVNVTRTSVDCLGNQNVTTESDAVGPWSNWPQNSTLPPNIQVLSPDLSFSALAQFSVQAPANWTYDYILAPAYDCKDCKEEGGEGDPVSSSVSRENQSLGEDVPVVGTGFVLHYESDRAPGALVPDPVASADAAMIGGWTLSVHHTYDANSNTLFLGDGTVRRDYEVGSPVSFNTNLLLTPQNGSEVYVFTPAGQHLQTLRPMTGALLYQFGYDSAGKLVTITDATGNVTTIARNSSEQPTAIISPYGQTTTLSVDGNGFLSQVTDPLGNSAKFVNSTTGLLMSRTDQNGNVFSYSYDAVGRLAQDSDSLGGYVSFVRTDATSGFGWSIAETTSMGLTSSYQTTLTLPWMQDGTKPETEQHVNIWPDGLQATSSMSLQNGQLTENVALPDGSSQETTEGPDPVWGIQTPVTTSETVTLGNLTTNVTGSRATNLSVFGNPFSVSSETDTQTINGRAYTSAFTGSTRQWVSTSPVGRTLTVDLDSLERVSSAQIEGLAATSLTYDSRGRLASAVQGSRKTTYTYNSNGFLASVTDPMSLTTSYTYDSDGRLQTETLPDGRVIGFSRDANGNLTSITPPGEFEHAFAYNAVDLPSSYTPPTVAGTGATTFAYNLDRNVETVTRPDGKTIKFGYDTAGRVISIGTPTGNTTLSYSSSAGNLAGEARNGEKIAYGYNGPLPIKSTWTGTVAGSIARVYNDNFWVTSESVGGGSNIALQYDNDGLLTKAGSLVVKRNAKNGLITSTSLGLATDNRTYNTFGELTGYAASVNGAAVYSVTYTRDSDGRVSAKTETVNGVSNSYSYTYDLAGRLTAVTKNGATDTYSYDSNSNRLRATTASGTSTGTYDAQDRLLTYGNATFSYTANGELASQTVGTQRNSYTYDVLGNLTAATLASGTKLAYVIDPENRRVGKSVNGVLQNGFLYDDNGHLLAELNGSNQVASQFVYGTSSISPDYMISGGVTYRIFSDQLGSPIVVVNTATGAIAEQITYDEFGNVLSDTSPGFQPFGFAGGLYDQDTKLLHFGARDYNPSVGRWTAKDPILFTGGDSNLYGYVLDDPINLEDPTGLDANDCSCEEKVKTQIRDRTRLRDRARLDQPTPLQSYENDPGLEDWGILDHAPGFKTGRQVAEWISGEDLSGHRIDRIEKLKEKCADIIKDKAQDIVKDVVKDLLKDFLFE